MYVVEIRIIIVQVQDRQASAKQPLNAPHITGYTLVGTVCREGLQKELREARANEKSGTKAAGMEWRCESRTVEFYRKIHSI